jgi:hypothetical protein
LVWGGLGVDVRWRWFYVGFIFFGQGAVLALLISFCMRERWLYVGLYCYFSLTPVRGGTFLLRQRK